MSIAYQTGFLEHRAHNQFEIIARHGKPFYEVCVYDPSGKVVERVLTGSSEKAQTRFYQLIKKWK